MSGKIIFYKDGIMANKNIKLFLVSFLSLYIELLLIKWIPAEVRIVGYFTNFILISSFFGLGVGFLLASYDRKLMRLLPLFLLILITVLTVFKTYYIKPSESEILFMEFNNSMKSMNLYTFLITVFFINSLVFLTLGREIGICFKTNGPSVSYLINISGGISGILAILIFSFLKLPPIYQFAFFLIIFLIVIFEKKFVFSIQVLLCISILFFVYDNDKNSIWSFYHKITVTPLQYNTQTGTLWEKYYGTNGDFLLELPEDVGFNISINDDYFQKALNLSDEYVNKYDYLKVWRDNYDLPFKLKKSGKVLIVGGGVGNDAAAAVKNGAGSVDVVEIEGDMIDIGKKSHPEFPYSDPKVNVIIDDARSFFNKTESKYDLIIFSYVDSHRLFSQMSSVRLDSFLYTVESFRKAEKLLAADGILFVNCSLSKTWVEQRIYKMLDKVFGKKTIVINGVISPAFINGNTAGINLEGANINKDFSVPQETLIATDDWPFIYLKDKTIPKEYLITIIAVISVIILLTAAVIKRSRIRISHDTLFFFIAGFAFFLLETKNITDIAVLFGSTWTVNFIVLLSVSTAILCANLAVMKIRNLNVKTIFLLLVISLTALLFVPLGGLAYLSMPLKLACSLTVIGLPIFFSSAIFCHYFKSSRDPETDFGMNIVGSIFGGFFEYLCLITGFKFLLIITIVAYMTLFAMKFIRMPSE
jgi:hypothetical protein